MKTVEEALGSEGYKIFKTLDLLKKLTVELNLVQTKKWFFKKSMNLDILLSNKEPLVFNKPLEDCTFSKGDISQVIMTTQTNTPKDYNSTMHFILNPKDFDKMEKYFNYKEKLMVVKESPQITQEIIIH